jgi:hypothetical protein
MNEVYPLKKRWESPATMGLKNPRSWIDGERESWQNHPQKKPAPAGELHAFGDVFLLVVSQKHKRELRTLRTWSQK